MIFAETHTTGNRIDISAEFKIFQPAILENRTILPIQSQKNKAIVRKSDKPNLLDRIY